MLNVQCSHLLNTYLLHQETIVEHLFVAPGTLSKDTPELNMSCNGLCPQEAVFTLLVWQLSSFLFPCDEGATEDGIGMCANRTSHPL